MGKEGGWTWTRKEEWGSRRGWTRKEEWGRGGGWNRRE